MLSTKDSAWVTAVPIGLSALVCRKHPQKDSSSFKSRMEGKARGLKECKKLCSRPRIEPTHKPRSAEHENKPWAFSCALHLSGQFPEALESCAAFIQ